MTSPRVIVMATVSVDLMSFKSVFAHVAVDTGSSAEAVISIAGIIARTMLKTSSHARILLC